MRDFQWPLITLGVLLTATSVQAAESTVRKSSTAPVETVWQKIGDFCSISSWLPGIEKCELSADKKRRTLIIKDGGVIVEELVRWSDAKHSYTYRTITTPFPITNYESTIQVTSAKSGKGSVITWRGHYDAKGVSDVEAKKLIDGVYKSGLAALADHDQGTRTE